MLINVYCYLHSAFTDIEWPEGDEALSEAAKATIDSLLQFEPSARPKASGIWIFNNLL